jgi:hypothetical protein
MANNSEGLTRIKSYFEDFSNAIEHYKQSEQHDAANCQDAYERAARIRERFRDEATNSTLQPGERMPLSKVCDNDPFIKGMMNFRHVGDHIKKKDDFIIRTRSNEPITLPAATSAMALFAYPIVTLNDIHGKPHRINHLEMLEEGQRRFAAAITKAENS